MEKFRQLRYNKHKEGAAQRSPSQVINFSLINRSVGKLGAVYFFISMRMSRMRIKTMISSFIGEHLGSEGLEERDAGGIPG